MVLEGVRTLDEPQLVDRVGERLEAVVQLPPRERRAEAVVRADAEGEVLARLLAVEVELLGTLEAPRVTVARAVAEVDDGAGRDRDPVELDVDLRLAQEALHRGLDPEHLLA